MRALGISIDPAGGKPRLFGVVLSGTPQSPTLEDEFELRATDTNVSEQVVDLARLLQAKLPGLQFDLAMIRTAGPSPVARRLKAQFSRAHAEGAALFVLHEHVKGPIAAGDPQSLARKAGMKKDELVAKAKSISPGKCDAAAAALSALAQQ